MLIDVISCPSWARACPKGRSLQVALCARGGHRQEGPAAARDRHSTRGRQQSSPAPTVGRGREAPGERGGGRRGEDGGLSDRRRGHAGRARGRARHDAGGVRAGLRLGLRFGARERRATPAPAAAPLCEPRCAKGGARERREPGERARLRRIRAHRAGTTCSRASAGPEPRGSARSAAANALVKGAPVAVAAAKPAAPQLAQMINSGGGFVPPIPGVGFGAFKVPQYRPNEGDRVIPFTRRRRITADHMTYSKFPRRRTSSRWRRWTLHKASRRSREANKDRYKKEGLSLSRCWRLRRRRAAARTLRESP